MKNYLKWPKPDDVEIDYSKQSPEEITQVKAGFNASNYALSVHIEEMDEHEFWCRIGNYEFTIKSRVKKGPGITMELKNVQEKS